MKRFDWAGLMQVGLHHLRLHPKDFWQLTPAELAMLIGASSGNSKIRRSDLLQLMAQFPDEGGDE